MQNQDAAHDNKSNLLSSLAESVGASTSLVSELSTLLKLDLELATVSTARIVVYAITTALLCTCLIFISLFTLGYWLHLSGVSSLNILLISGAIISLIAIFMVLRIKSLADNLSLRETRRQLSIRMKTDLDNNSGVSNAASA